MRTFWHDIWGCARGPITSLAPQTRIVVGAVMFAACAVAPATTVPGSLVILVAAASWLVACRPPFRVVRSFLLLGLAAFLPYFLLAPLVRAGPGARAVGWAQALGPPWSVFARGMAGILISTASITTLSASDLRQGLLHLPVPGVVTAILLQIVHQTGTLVYDARRVAMAIAVRGASNGWLTAVRLLCSLPRAWLPRVMARAERVAIAMEMRGYSDADLQSFGHVPARLADRATLGMALGVLALALAIRWIVIP